MNEAASAVEDRNTVISLPGQRDEARNAGFNVVDESRRCVDKCIQVRRRVVNVDVGAGGIRVVHDVAVGQCVYPVAWSAERRHSDCGRRPVVGVYSLQSYTRRQIEKPVGRFGDVGAAGEVGDRMCRRDAVQICPLVGRILRGVEFIYVGIQVISSHQQVRCGPSARHAGVWSGVDLLGVGRIKRRKLYRQRRNRSQGDCASRAQKGNG